MTARVGGLWASRLGEGRRWWIMATSDSHVHWTRGGADFWPGEYSKTYVLARQDYGDIMDGLRNGRIWVTTGDLITSLDLTANSRGRQAAMGETLTLNRSGRNDVEIEIRFRPQLGTNANGDRPQVRRVDLIVGQITGLNPNLDADTNPATKVVARFGPRDWHREGPQLRHPPHPAQRRERPLRPHPRHQHRRGRTAPHGPENPWTDLWFYSNPVFVHVR